MKSNKRTMIPHAPKARSFGCSKNSASTISSIPETILIYFGYGK